MDRHKRLPGFIALITLIAGTLIYVLFRDPPIVLSKFISVFGWSGQVGLWKNYFDFFEPPDWFLYNLPDALWMVSFMLVILIIWNFRWNRNSRIWIISCFSIALLYEILQSTQWVNGHFDVFDLVFIGLGAGIALLFIPLTNNQLNYD